MKSTVKCTYKEVSTVRARRQEYNGKYKGILSMFVCVEGVKGAFEGWIRKRYNVARRSKFFHPPTPSTKYSADLQNMPYIPSPERNKTTRDLQCAGILERTALLEHIFYRCNQLLRERNGGWQFGSSFGTAYICRGPRFCDIVLISSYFCPCPIS